MRSSHLLWAILLATLGCAGVSHAQDMPADESAISTPVIDTTTIVEDPAAPSDTVTEGETVPTTEDPAVPETVVESAPAAEEPNMAGDGTDLPDANGESIDPAIAAEVESFLIPLNPLKMPSLFFTKWEHDLLIDARRGANVRPVVPGDAGSELLLAPDGESAVHGSPREINLNGIAYVSPVSWTIWLNNIRITPTALLPEIMDLTVYKDRIEIEWLDRQTNQIYPIRLRPHEKFNMDTRMFLPADSE